MLFSGCSKHEVSEISPITNNFKCDFSIADSSLSGELSVTANGDVSFIFHGPDIINGIGIKVYKEIVTVEVQGISENYSRSEIPPDSPAVLVYDVLLTASEYTPTVSDGLITVNGKCDSGNFSLTLDSTGFITSITSIDSSAKLTFSNHIEEPSDNS